MNSRPYTRGKGGKRADLDNQYFRSRWEANWARYLNLLIQQKAIKSWTYESETFEFPVKRGSKFYTPDFIVVENDGSKTYYEIKGWMSKEDRTKLKRMERYHPAVSLVLIQRKEYYAVASRVSGILPGWEREAKKKY